MNQLWIALQVVVLFPVAYFPDFNLITPENSFQSII